MKVHLALARLAENDEHEHAIDEVIGGSHAAMIVRGRSRSRRSRGWTAGRPARRVGARGYRVGR